MAARTRARTTGLPRLRQVIDGEGWLIAAGILSVLFGLFLFVRPGVGALAVLWMLGLFAILFGVIVIAAGLRLRRALRQPA